MTPSRQPRGVFLWAAETTTFEKEHLMVNASYEVSQHVT